MPIYEYFCTDCGHEFETIQGIKERALSSCPACLQNRLRKKVTAAAFHLKGTGWYETDFKNSGKEKDNSKEAKPASDTETKKTDSDSTKSEPSKPSSPAEKSRTESSAAAS